jgi:hypothetical protein
MKIKKESENYYVITIETPDGEELCREIYSKVGVEEIKKQIEDVLKN